MTGKERKNDFDIPPVRLERARLLYSEQASDSQLDTKSNPQGQVEIVSIGRSDMVCFSTYGYTAQAS